MRCSLPVVSAVPLFELQRCAVRLDKAAAHRFRSAAPDNLAPMDCTTAQGGERCKAKNISGGGLGGDSSAASGFTGARGQALSSVEQMKRRLASFGGP